MPGVALTSLYSLLNTTLSAFMRNKHVMPQKLQGHPIARAFLMTAQSGLMMNSHAIEWVVALQQNTGSFRGVNYHESWAATQGPAPKRAKVSNIAYEGKGLLFDRRELEMNKDLKNQIASMMNIALDQFFGEVWDVLEADILARPVSPTDTLHFGGIPKWARPSIDSTGAFVANTAGSFGGTYIRYTDGTVGSSAATLAEIDASNVNYERWRNWHSTRASSVMTIDDCRAIRRANQRGKFRAFPKKIGEQTMGMVSIYMDQNDKEGYDDLVNAGPDDRKVGPGKADILPFDGESIAGVNIVSTPQLDIDPTNSIYGINHTNTFFAKNPAFFFKRGEFREMPNAHNSIYAPLDLCGNIVCTNPREGVWVHHGSH